MSAITATLGDALEQWLQKLVLPLTSDTPEVDPRVQERDLARAVANDPESFQLLYARYYERILNFFYRRVRERALAEDLTSQTFLAALEYLSRSERDVNFAPWLYRVATNAWLSHERRQRRWGERFWGEVGRLLHSPPATSFHEQISEAEQIEQVRLFILKLPEKDREPLLLRYFEGLEIGEIAEVLGVTPVALRSRISRAMQMLRERCTGEQ